VLLKIKLGEVFSAVIHTPGYHFTQALA